MPDTSVWKQTECMPCTAPCSTSLTGVQVWSRWHMFTQTTTHRVENCVWSLFPSSFKACLLFCLSCPAPLELTTLYFEPYCLLAEQHQSVQFFALSASLLITPTVKCLIRNKSYSVLNPSLVRILRGLIHMGMNCL